VKISVSIADPLAHRLGQHARRIDGATVSSITELALQRLLALPEHEQQVSFSGIASRAGLHLVLDGWRLFGISSEKRWAERIRLAILTHRGNTAASFS